MNRDVYFIYSLAAALTKPPRQDEAENNRSFNFLLILPITTSHIQKNISRYSLQFYNNDILSQLRTAKPSPPPARLHGMLNRANPKRPYFLPTSSTNTNITIQRFTKEGCPNCEHFLHLQGSPDMVQDCTSQVFEGLITLSDPTKSWVAKWQRIDKYVRGVYATKVSGILPEEVVDTVESEGGMRYIPRDGSATDAD